MRQAIETRYKGPTDHRGARVVARCDAGRVVVPWDHAIGVSENHETAARALASKLGWTWEHVGGGIGNGYVWVSPC